MNEFPWGVLVSLVSALGAAYAIFVSRKKVRAEADSVVVGSSEKLISIVMSQVTYLNEQVATYRAQVEEAVRQQQLLSNEVVVLRQQVRELHDFIQANNLTPPFPI